MNTEFSSLQHRGIQISLLTEEERAYIGSHEFKVRVSNLTEAEFVQLMVFMLANVALDPRTAQANIATFEEIGYAQFQFYGTCLPAGNAGMFVTDQDLKEKFRNALQANMSSKLYRAACKARALYSGAPKYRGFLPHQSRMLNAEHTRARASLNWCTSEDYKAERSTNSEGFSPKCREHDARMAATLNQISDDLRNRRLERLVRISRQSYTEKFQSWHTLLEHMAKEVFTPESDPSWSGQASVV